MPASRWRCAPALPAIAATAAGHDAYVAVDASGDRNSAIPRFPGGYIAELHDGTFS